MTHLVAVTPGPFSRFNVSRTYSATDELRAQVVSGVLDGRQVQVRYLEPSGEFELVTRNQRRAMTEGELRALSCVMERFQHELPWVDPATGSILNGLKDAISVSAFAAFQVRSVSALGHLVLLTGHGARGDFDVVLDTATRRVTVMEPCPGMDGRALKRAMTGRERADLRVILEAWTHRRLRGPTLRLITEVLSALRVH